jgi:hypothetical protein
MTDLMIFGTFVAIVAVVATIAIMAEKARKKRLTAEFEAAGFRVNFKPDEMDKHSALGQCGGSWSQLKTGSTGVQWTVFGHVGQTPVAMCEHRYTTGSGKNKSTHYNTIAATPAPQAWPFVELSPESVFHRIGELFGSKDFKVEDEAFNRKWRVKVTDEEFALLVLTPEVQAWCMTLPKYAQVRVGGGAVTVALGKYISKDATMLINRCVELSRMLPQELHAWEPVQGWEGRPQMNADQREI